MNKKLSIAVRVPEKKLEQLQTEAAALSLTIGQYLLLLHSIVDKTQITKIIGEQHGTKNK